MKRFALTIAFALLFLSSAAFGQRADVTVSLSEKFFDALLDGVFRHAQPPSFPISGGEAPSGDSGCRESVTLLRETDGTPTSVRFRDGKIVALIAFAGNYNPPFVGCVPFRGVAEATLNLEIDQHGQRLFGRAEVTNVNLRGSGGIGGGIIAKLLQSSIDKRINPVDIIALDKLSFSVPLRNSNGLSMRAVGVRHEVVPGQVNVVITYEFAKG